MFVHGNTVKCSTSVKLLILRYYYQWLFHTIYNLPYHQVQSSYSQHTHLFIDQRILAAVWRRSGNVRQVLTVTSCISTVAIMHCCQQILIIIPGRQNRSGSPGKCRTKISKLQPTITIYAFGMYMHRWQLTDEVVISFLSIV